MGNITINPDGVSVKGCSLIYAPAGQAGEYSPLATNPYRGCGHKCAYCYVPGVLRMSREEFDAGAVPRAGFIDSLKKEARKYQEAGITAQVMLSFTTDPYHPGDNSLTRQVIEVLQEHGLGVCTLTKGGFRALRDIDIFRPGRDAFASTLTSLDDEFSLKWERGAPLPEERIETLHRFHDVGIFTWVSLEPVLDTAATLARLFVIDGTPKNTESWFMARAVAWVKRNRPDVALLVSYADPSAGHAGTIYKAANWIADGRTDEGRKTPRCDYKVGGRMFSRRSHIPQGIEFQRIPRVSKWRFIYWMDRSHERRRSSVK